MAHFRILAALFVLTVGISSTQAKDVETCSTEFSKAMEDKFKETTGASSSEALKTTLCPIMETYGECLIEALGGIVSTAQLQQMISAAMAGSSVECDYNFLGSTESLRRSSPTTTTNNNNNNNNNNVGVLTDGDKVCIRAYGENAKMSMKANDIKGLIKTLIHCMMKDHSNPSDEDFNFIQDFVNKQLRQFGVSDKMDVRQIFNEARNAENGVTSSLYVSFWQKFATLFLAVVVLHRSI